MDLLSLGMEMVQTVAEQVASYKIGQSALRYIDKGLWVIEKCARWAVPPPLDQDERPQPELIRPLPWVFFLAMLMVLRLTRESISLLNLVLGKPPLRSDDVVTFIQSKRRYLRTLKYQGNRIIRARNIHSHSQVPWYSGLQSLFEFTMCFRRSQSYGNNNTTRVSNNDEVLVVKKKRPRESPSPVASTADENTMERLIEKMMVGLDAASDDDSSFTLTNARSDCTESEDDTIEQRDATQASINSNETTKDGSNIEEDTPVKEVAKSPNNTQTKESTVAKSPSKLDNSKSNNVFPTNVENGGSFTSSTPEKIPEKKEEPDLPEIETKIENIRVPEVIIKKSIKEEAQNFLSNERCSPQKTDRSPKKIANGRTSNKKRDLHTHVRSSDKVGRTTGDRM